MRGTLLSSAAAVVIAATAVVAQQTPPAPSAPPASSPPAAAESSKTASNVVTLSGCMRAAPNQHDVFTMTDEGSTATYRLTGSGLRKWVGQQVEVTGVPSKRLVIAGGLYPTPNVAARAGDIDPSRAAVAAQTESNSGTTNRIAGDIRVKTVRAAAGECKPQ
jgi:hypothetical protein